MSNCKACGKRIEWYLNSNGRWEPLNLDKSPHFETCTHAKQFRGKRKFKQEDHVAHLETPDSKQTRLKELR